MLPDADQEEDVDEDLDPEGGDDEVEVGGAGQEAGQKVTQVTGDLGPGAVEADPGDGGRGQDRPQPAEDLHRRPHGDKHDSGHL